MRNDKEVTGQSENFCLQVILKISVSSYYKAWNWFLEPLDLLDVLLSLTKIVLPLKKKKKEKVTTFPMKTPN